MLAEVTKKKLVSQLDELSDSNLLGIYREAMLWDGSFDFVDTFDFEELAAMTKSYEFGRSIVYGNVTNLSDPVRYDGYGNLESVSEYDLADEARDNYQLDELADWLLGKQQHAALEYYDGYEIIHTLEVYERTSEPDEDVCAAISAMFGGKHVAQGV